MKKGQSIFIILLLLFSIIISINLDSTVKGNPNNSYITETDDTISVGNDFIEVTFDKTYHGGIKAIIDKETGIDLFPDKDVIPTLFLFFMFNETDSEGALQWQAVQTAYQKDIGSDYATLTISNEHLKGYDIHAQTTITISNDNPFVEMKLTINNNEDFIIENILFPVIWGLGQIGSASSDDILFYPGADGILLYDPMSHMDQMYIPSGFYPGSVSMQVLCHYDPDETGLYVACTDTEGYPKKINYGPMEWEGVDHLATSFEFFIPENSGNDFEMDYSMIIGTFHGDWYTAAERYKSWAESTSFVSNGKISEEKDIPAWFLNTSIIQLLNIPEPGNTIYSFDDIVQITEDYASKTRVDTTVLVIGWEQHGAWIGPNYYPPIEGEQAFQQAMNQLRTNGHHGFIYISGTIWRITRDDIGYSNYEYFNDEGLSWVAIKKDGAPYFDPFYASIGWDSARMDPMTDFWHNTVVENALRGVELGVDVVQIDEFPISAIYPCYNQSHGHPIGYSKDISDAYCSILQDIRSQGRIINPDFIMSMEEPCEYYIPYVDTYVSRDNAPESLLYQAIIDTYGDDVEFIPFFSYVYHEYITSFGEGIGMDEQYANNFYNQLARALAKIHTTGEIMKVGGTRVENWNKDLFTLFNRTATATSGYANKYLIQGIPLPPPTIDVPVKKIEWYNSYADELGTPIHEPVVFHSVWRARDDMKGYVFVNWDQSDVEFDVELNDDVDFSFAAIRVTRNGMTSILHANTTLPTTISLSMQGNDVVLIELVKSIDSDAPLTPTIQGPSSGEIDSTIVYTINATDPDEDMLYYHIDWGDETNDYIGPYPSGKLIEIDHVFTKKGEYEIRVKAKDSYGLESAWARMSVSMPKTKWLLDPLERFLSHHPFLVSLLRDVI